MIQNDHQLESTREAVRDLESAMRTLHQDRSRLHPDRYALMADPVLEDLRRLRHEIDVYLGVDEPVSATVTDGLNGAGCERHATSQTVHEEKVTAEGTLREIDLDQGTFILRNIDTGAEIRCCIEPDNRDLMEIAKAGLDHWVTASGIRRRDPQCRQMLPLRVQAMAVVDSAAEKPSGR